MYWRPVCLHREIAAVMEVLRYIHERRRELGPNGSLPPIVRARDVAGEGPTELQRAVHRPADGS
jgi:hypothetical protein